MNTTTLDALHDEILSNPKDDTVRMIWADAHDEMQGEQTERGEFVRLQIELAQMGNPHRKMQCGSFEFKGGDLFVVDDSGIDEETGEEFQVGDRVDLEVFFRDKKRNRFVHGLLITKKENETNDDSFLFHLRRDEKSGKFPQKKWERLKEREKELLNEHQHLWLIPLLIEVLHTDGKMNDDRMFRWEWTRGFISSVTLTGEDWLRHSRPIAGLVPIEEVILTSLPEWDYVDSDQQIVYFPQMRDYGYDHRDYNLLDLTDLSDENGNDLTIKPLLNLYWPTIDFKFQLREEQQ